MVKRQFSTMQVARGAAVLIAAIILAGCARENVCYEPEEMPEFGRILRAVPCDDATEAPTG